jgi:two-component system chemotaxis response regulator CheY
MKEKLKAMIVDDSLMIVKTIQKYLSKYNVDIIGTASDGKTAIEVFNKTTPEIVTLDITMPEIDGLTVMQEMLSIDDTVKIIIISALNDKITKINAIKMGAVAFLEKPFTADKFDEVLERIL